MEAGRLEHVASPFDFHAALRSMLGSLRVATTSKGLDLVIDLDDRIDQIARAAMYDGKEDPQGRDKPAWVIGDEMRYAYRTYMQHGRPAEVTQCRHVRLRQIVTVGFLQDEPLEVCD